MSETMNGMADEMLAISKAYAGLPAPKREVFRARLAERGIPASHLPIVPLAPRAERFPLSHAQERLWFLWRLEPDSASYNMVSAVRFDGQFDVPAARGALSLVQARHETLRTRFEEADGTPWQVVDDTPYEWWEHDLGATLETDTDAALKALLAERSRRAFDLERGPLLRVSLVRVADEVHVLHFAMHHIVSDAWSIGVLTREFAALYAALKDGADTPERTLAPLPVQYGDYAVWQREWLDAARIDAQLEYWRGRLGAEHPVLELPVTRKRTGLRGAGGGRVVRRLGAARGDALRRLSQRHGATLFMTLLAAYDVLLARYSAQHDIRVGVPVAGRDRLETEGLIGFFVNTVVIRTELAGVQRFGALLEQVRTRVVEAQAHQELPFARLVDALQPARSLSHTPLFQAMFNYTGASRDEVELPGVTAAALPGEADSARFDLVLNVAQGDTLSVSLTFARDVFDEPVVARMLDHYVGILDQVSAQEDVYLGQIALDIEARYRTPLARHAFRPVGERFAAQAARRLTANAVHCEGERLSYSELESWSNRIARHLVESGAQPDERIGLCLTRTAGLIAALLGVLKSGAAFVPLDPDYPQERLAYMMGDAGVSRVVTDRASAGRHRGLLAGRGIVAIEDLRGVEGEARPAPAVEIHPGQLAYVIYTSGSTGRPKGVAISHGALGSHLADFIGTYGITEADKQLQSSTINFDVSLHEMLPALLCGGQVEMRGAQLWDIATTSRHLAEERVTFARIPTAYWQQWLREPPPAQRLGALRQITVGGEGLPGDALRQWREGALAHIRLDNLYGPTETTVACMFRETTAEDVDHAIVSIGEPYGSRTVYVLDGEGNEAPVGGLGELCIGGQTLARGYLDRAAQTAQRFIPDPYRNDGGRLYRTGDLCRRREDGTIDFLGRLDQQVKLRGFRIELGEIEAALRQVEGVREAVVELKGEGEGRRLVGYVSGDNAGRVDIPTLRRALAGRLPGHMVPGAFVVLARLPVMQNGKVDRRALPEPESDSAAGRVAPRTPREAALLAIWQGVLGRDDIGVTDNFFEIGGDSILSLQIIARARQANLLLSPRQVFEHPTVATLALQAAALPPEVQPTLTETHDAQVLTPIQQRFFERFPHGESHWNQAVLLRVGGALERPLLERVVADLVDAHDALRLRFHESVDGWRQQVVPQETARIVEYFDLRDDADWTTTLEIESTRLQQSLSLETGPILRVGYFEREGEARLLLAIHHLAVDGVSWRVLLDELQQRYDDASSAPDESQGIRTSLPDTLPWSIWVARQNAFAQSDAIQHEAAWWRAALRHARASLPVASSAYRAAPHPITAKLDAEWTRQLLQAAPRAYRTNVEDLLLTALTQTIAAWSGERGVLVSLEGHGREALDDELDLSRTVGWFTTQYPVWLETDEAPSTAIKGVKERLRAVPRKGLGFGWLRAALADLPVPQIGFNYLGQFDQSLETGGRFSFASESGGATMSDAHPADMVLDLNGAIANGCLSVSWAYRDGEVDESVVRDLAAQFESRLKRLIEHCAHAPISATASDFPLARIDQTSLEMLDLPFGEIDDLYVAAPVQQGVLFHSVWQDNGGVYLNQKRLTLHGELDHDRMLAAWQAAVDRHDILRTHFDWRHGGTALQVVQRVATVPYAVFDWHEAGDRYEARLAGWLAADIAQGFDLSRAPLLRINVFARPDGGHDLIWTDHHVLLDGWSVSQLMGEVLRHYAGDAIPARSGRYRDYIEWLDRRDVSASEAFWREQLASLEGPGRFAASAPHGADAKFDGSAQVGEREYELNASASERLATFARHESVTINTLVQAAWALLLQRYTGQSTVVFGSTVAGRPGDLRGVENLLGLFINTLPVIARVDDTAPVGDWLRRLQAAALASREHEHTPLNDIQRWAGMGGQALFDSIVVFENYPVDAALKDTTPHGLSFGALANREETNYPLTVTATFAATLRLKLSFDRSVFSDRFIEGVGAQVERLLSGLADDGTRRLGSVELLDAHARREVEAFSRCDAEYGDAQPVHRIVEAQVRATPDAIAVLFGNTTLSYAELNRQANRLAHRLQAQGVGPDVRVGIAVERSVEMVVGLLAIMKAGGAYVPFDPSYPAARLAYMMGDSGISLLLTQRRVRDALPLSDAIGVLELDALDLADEASHNLAVEPDGENLAYVIYTSGSTGQPKGAANRHGALYNRLVWMQQAYALDASDTVLQKTPFSFDVSVWEFFWPLMTGARLAVAAPDDHRDPQKLLELIERHAVTTLHFVPSMLQAFIAHEDVQHCSGLKRVICSGEALSTELKDRALAALPAAALYNLYGPTEAAIDVTHWTCHADDTVTPIGRPIANVQTYVLDASLNITPVGVAGELYLGGAGLARGYLNRSALTAERFVPDPFSAEGARLYRTGDLARWRADGALEYLGRIDHQVKIRGFRIELGEIEAQLLAQANVREAVVIAQESSTGTRLIGYVSASASAALSTSSLRQALVEALPGHMVPSAIVVLDAFPLSPNGKVDRKALPAPEQGTTADRTTTYEPPQTPTESAIAAIWEDILGIERIGRHDNFFELGGHSLLTMKAQRAIFRDLQTDIPLASLFLKPTLYEIAAGCDALRVSTHREQDDNVREMKSLLDELMD